MTRKSADRPKGQWVRNTLRLAIYLRDGFRCVYCGRDLHGAGPQDATLDHVVAWARGGSNEPGNLITACRPCNCSRQARRLAQYADAHTRLAVRRQTRRSITRYRAQALAIIRGECPEGTVGR